jgi:RNA polymerase sigma-70 factor (ECF subfamily)
MESRLLIDASDFEQYRTRLTRIARVRIEPQVAARIDADDVVQESFLDALKRRADFDPQKGSLLVWLRFLVLQKVVELHRKHLGVEARNAGREVRIGQQGAGDASSVVLASILVGQLTSPSRALQRAELVESVQRAVGRLSENDREILLMRHFEQLSNQEAAEALNLSKPAACSRYVRALERLQELLGEFTELASFSL